MKYLRMVYGRGTHALRVFNFILTSMWLALMISSLSGDLALHLPDDPRFSFNFLGLTLVTTMGLTGLSFFIKGWEGVLLRMFSLTTGAWAQLLVADRFSATYPPLDVMGIFASIVALWFVGGAFFVCNDPTADTELEPVHHDSRHDKEDKHTQEELDGSNFTDKTEPTTVISERD